MMQSGKGILPVDLGILPVWHRHLACESHLTCAHQLLGPAWWDVWQSGL